MRATLVAIALFLAAAADVHAAEHGPRHPTAKSTKRPAVKKKAVKAPPAKAHAKAEKKADPKKAAAKPAPAAKAAVPGPAAEIAPTPAANEALARDDGDEDGDEPGSENPDAADAVGIQEDLAAGKKELEELLQAEEQVIDAAPTAAKGHGLLGYGNPLRARVRDDAQRMGELYGALDPRPEGDAGQVLAELSGLDLAQLKAEYDIPVEINDDVLDYIRFFQTTGRKWYVKWLGRSERWVPLMKPILAEEGVPLDLVYLAMIESGFSPYAYSWAKASGFWQFISPTGRRYGLRDDFWVDERRDPILSTRAAARYLKDLHEEMGDWYLAWASYNAGEGKLRRAIKMYGTRDFWEITRAGKYLKKETKHYVPKLIAAAIIAKHPERFGFTEIEREGEFDFDEVEIPDATDLQVIAQAAGVTVETVQAMNMSLRRWCTPPARGGKGYVIKLPKGTKDTFLAAFEKVAPSERLTFRHHRIQKGDTIGAIARKYGMPGEAILKLNGVKSAKALRVNTDLIIPLPTQVAQSYPDLPGSWNESKKQGRRGHTSGTQVASTRRGTTEHVAQKSAPAAGGKSYTVRGGDTLWSIAQQFGVEVDALKRWNGFGSRGHKQLQVGRVILVGPPKRTDRVATKGRG